MKDRIEWQSTNGEFRDFPPNDAVSHRFDLAVRFETGDGDHDSFRRLITS